MTKGYRADIDGLRAIAVLAVLWFHAFPLSLSGGFIGVDVFFVISGFLISTILFDNLEKDKFSIAGFYARRIKRIFPALVLVLMVTFIFGWLLLLTDEFRQLGRHIAASAIFVQNLILRTEAGYFDNIAELKPLLHLWSLGIEEQFYIIWPLILWATYKRRMGFAVSVIVLFTLSFIANIHGMVNDPYRFFYSPLTRLWELMAGSLLAWALLHPRQWIISFQNSKCADLLSGCGFLILVIGFILIDKTMVFPGVLAIPPVLGAVCIIMGGPNAWLNKNLLSHKVAVWFGLISYPLYLWHWPILSFSRIVSLNPLGFELRLGLVLLSILLAYLTYRFVELPVRTDKFTLRRVQTISVGLMIVVSALGYSAYRLNGYPWRLNPITLAQLESQAFTRDLGRPPGAQIMLLGDSHGMHLVPGLKKEFGDLVADYASPGCIPFFDLDHYDRRIKPGDCAKKMTGALNHFETNPQMTGIILTSMGPVYLTETVFKGTEPRGQGDHLVLLSHPEIKDRWQIYLTGLRETLKRLVATGKNILFVFDVPELDFDPRSCMERPLSLLKTRIPCGVLTSEFEQRVANYREAVMNVLKDFPSVAVHSPADTLCDSSFCHAMVDNTVYYRDGDHLTGAGSNFVVLQMKQKIKALMVR